ncbi:MAG TPA: biotin--[acetyl-CoA-carboxylase] ligase [Acidobacteriota bacterium]
MTTCPEYFHAIHLGRCRSTNEYVRTNLPRLARDLPLMVSAAAQTEGRGREGRGWYSAPDLGIYATFAFTLAERFLSFLSLAAGVAVADMLAGWTGGEFTLKWPNDVLGAGRKVAGVLCENIVASGQVTCLVGIGINVNHGPEDFPEELRERAGSLRLVTEQSWPLADGRARLAASMAAWLQRLAAGRPDAILTRARRLSRSFLGREIQFHKQGRILRGTFRGLAADGGLRLEVAGQDEQVFYNGEIIG